MLVLVPILRIVLFHDHRMEIVNQWHMIIGQKFKSLKIVISQEIDFLQLHIEIEELRWIEVQLIQIIHGAILDAKIVSVHRTVIL